MTREPKMDELAARLGIPGLAFRPLRGEEDHSLIAGVLNRSNEADGLDYVITTQHIANWLAHRSDLDPRRDVVVAEVNGEPIGCGWVRWREETEGDWIYGHHVTVIPEWRTRGVWEALVDYCEARLREIAADHPAEVSKFLSTHVDECQQEWAGVVRSRGYEPVRYFYEMVRDHLDDLPSAPLPPGLEVRPVEPGHYRAVWDALMEAFRDHWGYSEPEEEDYQRWLSRPHFAPDLWQVAWDGEQVAGAAINAIDEEENRKLNRRRGYIHTLGVRRPWRGRGLGRALLVRSLAVLREQGMTEASLDVDAENPTGALRLYESVGFHPVRRSAVWRKRMTEEDTDGTTDP